MPDQPGEVPIQPMISTFALVRSLAVGRIVSKLPLGILVEADIRDSKSREVNCNTKELGGNYLQQWLNIGIRGGSKEHQADASGHFEEWGVEDRGTSQTDQIEMKNLLKTDNSNKFHFTPLSTESK